MAKNERQDAETVAPDPEPDARFGYDVVGEDGRRIHRNLSLVEAKEEKARIEALNIDKSGERLAILASDVPAPSVSDTAGTAPFEVGSAQVD